MKRAGVAPTVVTFGCLLNACCAPAPDPSSDPSSDPSRASNAKSREMISREDDANAHVSVSRAYDLLSQMSLYGVCPNDRCQNALVRAVAEAGRVDDALDEVKKIARGGGSVRARHSGGRRLGAVPQGLRRARAQNRGLDGRARLRARARRLPRARARVQQRGLGDDGVARARRRRRKGGLPPGPRGGFGRCALCRAAASSGLDSSDARVMTRRAVGVFETAIREGVALEGEDDDVDFTTVGAEDAPAGQYCPVRPPLVLAKTSAASANRFRLPKTFRKRFLRMPS